MAIDAAPYIGGIRSAVSDETGSVRHQYFRQGFGIQHRIGYDYTVQMQQIGDHCVNLIRLQGLWTVVRHGPVNVVINRRRIRPVAAYGFNAACCRQGTDTARSGAQVSAAYPVPAIQTAAIMKTRFRTMFFSRKTFMFKCRMDNTESIGPCN